MKFLYFIRYYLVFYHVIHILDEGPGKPDPRFSSPSYRLFLDPLLLLQFFSGSKIKGLHSFRLSLLYVTHLARA